MTLSQLNYKLGSGVMLTCVIIGITVLLVGQYYFHKDVALCHNVNDPCFQESANMGMFSIFGAIFAFASIPFTMLFTDTSQRGLKR